MLYIVNPNCKQQKLEKTAKSSKKQQEAAKSSIKQQKEAKILNSIVLHRE
jgi:hypothetical protein